MAITVLQSLLTQARQAMAGGDTALAHRAYSQAHALVPGDNGVLVDLAVACLGNAMVQESLQLARQAAAGSRAWRAHMVVAHASQRLDQLDECVRHIQLALGDPAMPPAVRAQACQQWAQIALNGFGDPRAAATLMRSAAALDPALDFAASLADGVAALYTGGLSAQAVTAQFTELGRRLTPPALVLAGRRRRRGARLRVGLVASQFCASPVGFLTLGALSCLAQQVDLVYLDRGSKADWANAAFRATARQWHDCAGMDATRLCQVMLSAGLDTMIDLGGWTDPVVLQALLARPVPRQLKWVGGQAASTGLGCFDGFITDGRQVPTAAASHYSEPLLRARLGYVSYTAPPYASWLAAAAAKPPPMATPAPGLVAVAANPAKISAATAEAVLGLKPKRLVLIDRRWRHEGTRQAARQRLGSLMDVAEFRTPDDHPGYLQTLQSLDATFVDTLPYAMGLAAIELRLLGRHIHAAPRRLGALMCERHAVAHMAARRFDHHAALARQLLQWCQPSPQADDHRSPP